MQGNLEKNNNFNLDYQYFFNDLPLNFLDNDGELLNNSIKVNPLTENNINSIDKITFNNLLEKKEKLLSSIHKLSELSQTITLNKGQQKINDLNQRINKLYDNINSQIQILKSWTGDPNENEKYILFTQQESKIKDNMRSLRDEIKMDSILSKIKRQSLFLETAQNYKIKLLKLNSKAPSNEVILIDKLIDIIKNQVDILRQLESNSLNFLDVNEFTKSKNLKLEEAYNGNLIEQDIIRKLLWSLKEEARNNQSNSPGSQFETSLDKQRKLLTCIQKDRKKWITSSNMDKLVQVSDEAIKITQDQIKLLEVILNFVKVNFPVQKLIETYKHNLRQQRDLKIKLDQLIAPSTDKVETPLNSNNKRRLSDNTQNTNNYGVILSNGNTENQYISQNTYFMPMFNQNISKFDNNNLQNAPSDNFSFN